MDAAISSSSFRPATVRDLSVSFTGTGVRLPAYACGAENRSRLGLCQPVCFCLCDNGFYASAPVQPDRPGPILRFNLIVAIEGLAHTVSQILGKSLHPARLILTFDILNFQVCLHIRQYVHRGCNRVEACCRDERAYLEKKVVSQCLPEHLIPFPHATDSFGLGQRCHLHLDAYFKTARFLN